MVVVVPVAEVERYGLLVIDIGVLGVLHGARVPDKVFPVDLCEAFLGLFKGQFPVVGVKVGLGGIVAPPAPAVRVADGRVRLFGIVLRGQQVIGHQHAVFPLPLPDYHRLPAVVLVELHHGAVAGGVGDHVMVAGADGGVVPDVHRLKQGQRLADGRAAVQPQAHDDSGSHVMLRGVLLRRLLRQGHDGSA